MGNFINKIYEYFTNNDDLTDSEWERLTEQFQPGVHYKDENGTLWVRKKRHNFR